MITFFQVATGAPIPLGADAVVMVEDTELEADEPGTVKVYKPVYPRQNASPHTLRNYQADLRQLLDYFSPPGATPATAPVAVRR